MGPRRVSSYPNIVPKWDTTPPYFFGGIMIRSTRRLAGFAPLLAVVTAACASAPNRRATSVVDYLYPDKYSTVEPSVPVLSLPLKVGIAFVPASSRVALQSVHADDNIPEADRLRLLRDVSAGFKAL